MLLSMLMSGGRDRQILSKASSTIVLVHVRIHQEHGAKSSQYTPPVPGSLHLKSTKGLKTDMGGASWITPHADNPQMANSKRAVKSAWSRLFSSLVVILSFLFSPFRLHLLLKCALQSSLLFPIFSAHTHLLVYRERQERLNKTRYLEAGYISGVSSTHPSQGHGLTGSTRHGARSCFQIQLITYIDGGRKSS